MVTCIYLLGAVIMCDASDDLLIVLVARYLDSDIAIIYGAISRECIRHQVVAR